ncbi:MAG TPA: hypothetical protein VLZ55_05570 [Rhodanobacter sp.]|nr:hypothetical protein [Rhodanobacter sp.]
MQRATRQRVGVFLAVLVLLALAAWQWQHDARNATGSVLTLAPERITHIALTIGATPAMHYAKRDGHWWRVDGTPVPADDGRLAELANTAAAPVMSWRAASDFDPAKIGLHPPQAILSLDGQTLEFGATVVTGAQRYVRVGQRMALVPERFSPRPPTGTVRQAGQ